MPFIIYSQEGITFKIENLKKPDKLLSGTSHKDIFQGLIISDASFSPYVSDVALSAYGIRNKNIIDFPYNIVAQSNLPDSLVSFGYNSFFYGMYQAYADHRPFVLSPDIIWLLICQGFARHVNANTEELRDYFADFSGKVTLVVQNDQIRLDDPKSPWDSVFSGFTKQIGKYTGKGLLDVLSPDFSTTTPIEKVASEITIMEAMNPYFDFLVIKIICGIPEITLEGKPEDWQKVLDKAQYLRRYDLDWWVDEITPLLEEFVKASKGHINKEFWRNMFKYHSQEKYGAPKIIDGWIVKFFPYDKNGKRNNLEKIEGGDNLPPEIVKADLNYIEIQNDQVINTPLELWAGIIGLDQDKSSFSLKPKIGWMIRKKDVDNKALLEKLNSDKWAGIRLRVKTVPKELLRLERIKNLEILFINEIIIPDEMSKIKIDRFKMSGKISGSEIERICKLFPNTRLIINDKEYNTQ